jgi:hypothetical protein
MNLGAVDWLLRDEHWVGGGREANSLGKLRLTKAEQNGLIAAPRHYHILAIPHQPANEFVGPESFRF